MWLNYDFKHIVTYTRWGRSLMLKVTLPVGGATRGSTAMTYMEKRGSWRVISNTWNWVLGCRPRKAKWEKKNRSTNTGSI